jgi:hypothetical protein
MFPQSTSVVPGSPNDPPRDSMGYVGGNKLHYQNEHICKEKKKKKKKKKKGKKKAKKEAIVAGN